jgi:TonB-dependent SusC/RagA subfamily outer membrane receptor
MRLVSEGKDPLLAQRVTVQIKAMPIMAALESVLHGTGLTATLASDGETVMIRDSTKDSDARARVSGGVVVGRVVDSATAQGLGGAVVQVVGTKLSALTTDSGRFTLRSVPAGEHRLAVKLFGYRPIERNVTVTANEQMTVRIVLAPMANMLTSVVTTAVGQQRRIEVGNDITVLNADSIMRVAPVMNITDLLETRVPGLVVQHTSGTPGAPSRLRLRGSKSLLTSDDPIVIVDGIRIYADQSGSLQGPLPPDALETSGIGSTPQSVGGGSSITTAGDVGDTYAGPSALDQIDMNSIETIEVLKGPSATAIYGSDAANGVIVITTKRGRAGPTHWSLSADAGRTTLQGDWPVNYARFGHAVTSPTPFSQICSIGDPGKINPNGCVEDSTVAYQALNDSRWNMLQAGATRHVSLSVSGGNGGLTYSLTGSTSNQTGYLHLPTVVAQVFDSTHGFPAPHWMMDPERYTTYGGTGVVTAQLGQSGASITVTSSLLQSDQQQSSLQNVIQQLSRGYFAPGDLDASPISSLSNDVSTRVLAHTVTSNSGIATTWSPWWWLSLQANAGINFSNRDNNALLPRDYALTKSVDTAGAYSVSRGTNTVKTLNIQTTLFSGRLVPVAAGLSVVQTSVKNYSAHTEWLPIGVEVPTTILYSSFVNSGPLQMEYNNATYGWYVQPQIRLHNNIFISPGLQIGGGSSSGTSAKVNLFPKTDLSWVAVDRSASDALFGVLTVLRPRVAFGIAGVQPGPTMQYRLWQPVMISPVTAGGTVLPASAASLYSLGNTQIHPERSAELEGGVDMELWGGRVKLGVT